MIVFDFKQEQPADAPDRLQAEWLETNGIGGWASTTIAGANSRRYHGLLVAATQPPTERSVMVSKLDETIVIDGQRFELSTNNYGEVIHPNGDQYLQYFSKHLFTQFEYLAGGVHLRKSILMIHGENTTIIKYDVVLAPDAFEVEFLPLLADRSSHQLVTANNAVNTQGSISNGQYRIGLYHGSLPISIQLAGAEYFPNPQWYHHFQYKLEQYRGLEYLEDLFTPVYFTKQATEGDSFYVLLTTEEKGWRDPIFLFSQEVERRRALIRNEDDSAIQQLVLSADQFIVHRKIDLPAAAIHANTTAEAKENTTPPVEADGKTVIAGYPWFTDWSRDTMIALPGLCLATKRFDDARKILHAFSFSVDQGMLPNRFQDNGEPPEYNTVDGTLWYFIAIYEYFKASGDRQFVLKDLLPVLKDIIDWHYRGTRYNIHVTPKGLLYAGEAGYQLTWMDARIGDWVVTPRMGRPVEVQALWYNALRIFSELLALNDQLADATKMRAEAEKARTSFNQQFWYVEGGYCYDVIDEHDQCDRSLRPNQLLALSLPFEILDRQRGAQMLMIVEKKLYTPKGIRTLSPDDDRYTEHYGGDQWHRDSAYHQGIAWSWLLGPYIDALFKVNDSTTARTKAGAAIARFLPHLEEAGIGTVSEIFDGDTPFASRGCIAQAWGVGEVLRVIRKYKLEPAPMPKGRKLKALF